MKVLVAGYQAVSILHGGPDTQIRNTVRHLPEFGVTAELFDPWKRMQKEDCDLFHIFAANIGTYHLAREIHALGIPLVVSPIMYGRRSPRFVRNTLRATRTLQRVSRGFWSDYALAADICGWAKVVLPNTRAEADLVNRGLGIPSSHITVIPNGVDDRFYDSTPDLFRKKYGLENFILNVGHIGHERKNVLTLIKALAQIDHPAVIIGRIIDNEYGRACVREATRYRHILLIDGLDNSSEMLASAYAACDVFVLPSLFETPGIAALEAGLAGAKVVITRHGGTREYFENMAIYVNPESAEDIRKGILRAMVMQRNTGLKNHIRSRFLWSRVAELTAQAYRTVYPKM